MVKGPAECGSNRVKKRGATGGAITKPQLKRKPTKEPRGVRTKTEHVKRAITCFVFFLLMIAKPQTGEEKSFLSTYGHADIVQGLNHPSWFKRNAEERPYIKANKSKFDKYRQAYEQMDPYLEPFLTTFLDEVAEAIQKDNLKEWHQKHMSEYVTLVFQGFIMLLFRDKRSGNEAFSSKAPEDQFKEVEALPSIVEFMGYEGAESTGATSPNTFFEMMETGSATHVNGVMGALRTKIPVPSLSKLVDDAINGEFITYKRKSSKGKSSKGERSNGESSKAATAMDADMPQEEIENLLGDLQKSVQGGEPKAQIEATLNLFNQPLQDNIRAGLKLGVFSYETVTYQLTLKEVLKTTVMHFYALYWIEFSGQDGQKRLETLKRFQDEIHMGPETIGWQPMWKNLLEMQTQPSFQIDESPKFGSFVELVQWIAETTEILVETVVQIPDEDVTFEQVRDAFLRALQTWYPNMEKYPCSDVVGALQYNSGYTIQGTKYVNLRSEMKAKAAAIQKEKEAARPAFSLDYAELAGMWLDLPEFQQAPLKTWAGDPNAPKPMDFDVSNQ